MSDKVSKSVVEQAVKLAESIKADAILVLTETGESYDLVSEHKPKIPVVAATPEEGTFKQLVKKAMIDTLDIDFLDITKGETSSSTYAMKLTHREASRLAGIEDAIVLGIRKGIFGDKDVVVIVSSTLTDEADAILIYEIKKEDLDFSLFEALKKMNIKQDVFEAVLNVALEIGREGREGRLVGTAFIVGDSEEVMKRSKQLVMNPFKGHLIGERAITNPAIKETVKELSQLDGVFVITEDGVIEAAGRHLNVDVDKVDLPQGFGSMHAAVSAVTMETNSLGIIVSKSGGIVRVMSDGATIKTIEPQKRIALSL
ncbi:MAG: diadenylate cyclase [Candidatus Hydrothermarchaeales archaeon]